MFHRPGLIQDNVIRHLRLIKPSQYPARSFVGAKMRHAMLVVLGLSVHGHVEGAVTMF